MEFLGFLLAIALFVVVTLCSAAVGVLAAIWLIAAAKSYATGQPLGETLEEWLP